MDIIYSRNRIKIPKINMNKNGKFMKDKNVNKVKIVVILFIAIFFSMFVVRSVKPVLDKESVGIARTMATKIANEESRNIISKYKYEDLCQVQVDDDGNIKMIKTNVITLNELISNVSVNIQKEFEKKSENGDVYVRMGTLTGSKFLSGRGPKIAFKISNIGNVDTDLKSSFITAGINQTLHRIFLEVKCKVIILTPFDSIEEEITNQILLAESVIIGNVPDTYYNLEGLTENDALNVLE